MSGVEKLDGRSDGDIGLGDLVERERDPTPRKQGSALDSGPKPGKSPAPSARSDGGPGRGQGCRHVEVEQNTR